MTIPFRLASGAGNPPASERFMADYDWLTALRYGSFVFNGGMEIWNQGTSFTNPASGIVVADNWAYRKSGTSSPTCDVSRDNTGGNVHSGTYSLKFNITVAGSADSFAAIDQSVKSFTRFAGLTVLFGARIKVSTASKVRLKVTDGVTTLYSSYHTGSGSFELLQRAFACSSSLSLLTVSIEVTSDFTGAIYADSVSLFIIPPLMTAAAYSLLEYSLLDSPEAGDVFFGFGTGQIIQDTDGSGRLYRVTAENGIIGLTQV